MLLRTDEAKRIEGGFSTCMGQLLKRCFGDEAPMRTSGVVISGGAGHRPFIVFAKLSMVLADEAALKALWHFKGASGLLCCVVCWNVCSLSNDDEEDTLVAHDATHTLVDIRCKFAECRVRSDEDVFNTADLLARSQATMNPTDFENLERSCGFTYVPAAPLWDLELRRFLRPVSTTRYDPTHIFYSNGIVNKELELLLTKLQEVGVGFEVLANFFGLPWKSPLRKLIMNTFFSEARGKHFKKKGSYSSQASDLVALIPPMRHFLYSVPGLYDLMPLEARSWDALADVHASMRKCKNGVVTELNVLRQRLEEHGDRVQEAYGDDASVYVPKWHARLHLPDQCEADGFLMDTFAGERKNYMIKQACEPVKNTISFERSALARVYLMHKHGLHNLRADGLAEPSERVGDARASLGARWLGVDIKEGVLFFQDDALCEATGFMEEPAGCVISVAFGFDPGNRVTPAARRWKRREEVCFVQLAQTHSRFRFPAMWLVEADGAYLVLER
jgi:hypothetical protein